ncbi:MAG: C40 family peptidase [Myxococcaceae bacterium]|nr:C40 family peptidase [Myxococcaceae bacterium]
MSMRISDSQGVATSRPTAHKPTAKTGAQARVGFLRDELSTGRGRAHRSGAQKAVGVASAGQDVQRAFERRIAALERAVADGIPGAAEELAAVRRDRDGVQSALSNLEQRIAANEDPKTWANVKPPSRAKAEQAQARAQLRQELAHLREFGVKVAKMNPKERQELQDFFAKVAKMTPKERKDLENFFRMAKEDPEGLKRFFESQGARPEGASPVNGGPSQAPAGIAAAIDFGRSQVGAPYVGGASPFRFGRPGDGNTYQMEGQRAYLSPKGVVGYDCSGLMVTMLKKAGIDISRFSSSRAMKANLPQVPKDQLQPGDLLVKNGHVSMYIGNGQMIEAVPTGVRVTSASKYLNDPAYSGHRPG